METWRWIKRISGVAVVEALKRGFGFIRGPKCKFFFLLKHNTRIGLTLVLGCLVSFQLAFSILQVVWDAYRDVRTLSDDDICWFYGCIRTMEIVETYHPNRVVRQFGHIQSIPQSPIPPTKSARSGNAREYSVTYASRDDDFIHFVNHLVNKRQRMGKVSYAWECTDDYMEWYKKVVVRRLTGVRRKKQRDAPVLVYIFLCSVFNSVTQFCCN